MHFLKVYINYHTPEKTYLSFEDWLISLKVFYFLDENLLPQWQVSYVSVSFCPSTFFPPKKATARVNRDDEEHQGALSDKAG